MSEQSSDDTLTQARTLYMVLQGEFAIYRQEDRIRILAPDLDDHVYRAGPWLAETSVPPATPLTLVNATGGCQTGSQGSNLLINVGAGSPNPDAARLDITAPWPKAIRPGLREQSTPDVRVTVNGTLIDQPPFPAVILILEYEWTQRPYLTSARGDKSWLANNGDPFAAIHIYASGENPEDMNHSIGAFRAAAQLLGVDASISWDSAIEAPRGSADAPPPGLCWYQVNLLLSSRLKFTQDLGQTINGWPSPDRVFSTSIVNTLSTNNCGPISNGDI